MEYGACSALHLLYFSNLCLFIVAVRHFQVVKTKYTCRVPSDVNFCQDGSTHSTLAKLCRRILYHNQFTSDFSSLCRHGPLQSCLRDQA